MRWVSGVGRPAIKVGLDNCRAPKCVNSRQRCHLRLRPRRHPRHHEGFRLNGRPAQRRPVEASSLLRRKRGVLPGPRSVLFRHGGGAPLRVPNAVRRRKDPSPRETHGQRWIRSPRGILGQRRARAIPMWIVAGGHTRSHRVLSHGVRPPLPGQQSPRPLRPEARTTPGGVVVVTPGLLSVLVVLPPHVPVLPRPLRGRNGVLRGLARLRGPRPGPPNGGGAAARPPRPCCKLHLVLTCSCIVMAWMQVVPGFCCVV